MPPFTNDQLLILGLVFLLGLVIGMALMAGGKWKRRYREEAQLRKDEARKFEALQAENAKLRAEIEELGTLRHAAVKSERAEVERLEAERREGERRQADRRDPPL